MVHRNIREALQRLDCGRSDLNMKLGEKCGEGAAAMAEGELGLEVDLGHGAVELWQVEKRIIAKAAGAARGVQDHTFDGAIGLVCWLALTGGDECAMVARGAPR